MAGQIRDDHNRANTEHRRYKPLSLVSGSIIAMQPERAMAKSWHRDAFRYLLAVQADNVPTGGVGRNDSAAPARRASNPRSTGWRGFQIS
jgi:hypothetical protein